MRNGVVIADCSGAAGTADPDPCLDTRTVVAGGDVELTVLTSHASLWGVVVRGLFASERKCSNGVVGSGMKVAKAQAGANAKCLKATAKGDELDAQACLTADNAGKVAGAKLKTAATAAGKCVPAPPFGFTSATAVNNASQQALLGLIEDLFGNDLTAVASTDKDTAACQAAALKGVTTLLQAKAKIFIGCQKAGLSGKSSLIVSNPQLSNCFDVLVADASGKIAGAAAKMRAALADKCGELVSPALVGACGRDATCLDSRVECRICQMFNAIDGLSENCDRFDDGNVNGSCS